MITFYKSKDNHILAFHVLVYVCGLLLMTAFNFIYFKHGIYIVAWIVINAAAHFFTDWITSRASSLLYKEERYREFFSVIGIDQYIHYFTLFGTFVWLSNL